MLRRGGKRGPRYAWLPAFLIFLWGSSTSLVRAESGGVPEPRHFQVNGVVKRLEPDGSSVVIQHEAIPNYMDAMTMPFRAKDPKELAGIRPGDGVAFRLLVTEEESWIDRVVKVKAAVATPSLAAVADAESEPAASARPPARHPLLDFAFTNEFGRPVRLSEFRGKALALTFIFTRCPIPDYCPRLSKNFQEASRKLANLPAGPTNWHFLSVSFDTSFDTPAILKAYGERYNYDPSHWSFLTGPADKIAELARLSDVTFESSEGLFAHNLRTLIVDPAGQLQMNFPIGGNLSDAIVSEIVKAAAATNPPAAR